MGIIGLNAIGLDGNVVIKRGEGGVTINNQDKVVDITENGTTEVVADDGYTGLGKVTINTEVSGGGESGGYIFYDQKRIDMNGRYLWERSSSIKVNMNGQLMILLTGDHKKDILDNNMESIIVAVCIDPNLKYQINPDDPLATIFEKDSESLEWVNDARITEEQFYDLNA